MTGSPELLEFYLVEATEYLDALDQLVAGTGGAPDGNAFIATARALRGASSMAKADGIEAIAVAMEQIAHAVHEGEVRWTLDLLRALRDTVDDLRFLVRGVRTWGERESARAQARLADLQRFLPAESPRQGSPTAAATAPVFLALQSAAIAAELDAFVANPRQRRALDDALTRARTMRGIAGIGDFPPLADVADAVDRGARSLMPDAPLSDADVELFRAAAEVLRQSSARLRAGGTSSADAPDVARFARAVAAATPSGATPAGEPVVPIEQLFYADGGPHVVDRAALPPETRSERLRREVVVHAEHLQRLAHDAREAGDSTSRDGAARSLLGTARDLASVLASFGLPAAAAYFDDLAQVADPVTPWALRGVEAASALLLAPGAAQGVEHLERQFAALGRQRTTPPPPVSVAAPAPSTTPPGAQPSPFGHHVPRRPPATPTGRELQQLLQEGIAGFGSLDVEPLSEPARLDEDEIVPIESLLYRGRAAIDRAIEVRDALRARGAADDAALQEIFDLLDLAQSE